MNDPEHARAPGTRPPRQSRTGLTSTGARKAASKSARSRSREFGLQALYQHLVGRNPLPDIDTFTRKGVSPSSILSLSLCLMLAGLTLFAMLGSTTFAIAVGITVLGFIYSLPGLHAKSIVVLSSLVHLVGGFLHFLLGYSLFAPIDADAMQIATVFALVFTAGQVSSLRKCSGTRSVSSSASLMRRKSTCRISGRTG